MASTTTLSAIVPLVRVGVGVGVAVAVGVGVAVAVAVGVGVGVGVVPLTKVTDLVMTEPSMLNEIVDTPAEPSANKYAKLFELLSLEKVIALPAPEELLVVDPTIPGPVIEITIELLPAGI